MLLGVTTDEGNRPRYQKQDKVVSADLCSKCCVALTAVLHVNRALAGHNQKHGEHQHCRYHNGSTLSMSRR